MFAETCPQYLFLTARIMDRPGLEGAKWIAARRCATGRPGGALAGLALGTCRSSRRTMRPTAFDETGKLVGRHEPDFKKIANGMPGLEARLPLLFDAMVFQGSSGLQAVRRADRDRAGEDLWPESAQGLDRRRRAMPTSPSGIPSRAVILGATA